MSAEVQDHTKSIVTSGEFSGFRYPRCGDHDSAPNVAYSDHDTANQEVDMKIRTTAVAMMATLLLSFGATNPATAVEKPSATDASAPAGQWVAYSSDPTREQKLGPLSAGPDAAAQGAQVMAAGCASGTTNYPGQTAFNCLSVTQDGSLEKVVLRQGQSGASGFGYLHALLDHNVEQQTIEHTVSNTGGYRQQNGRYLYGAYYQDPDGNVVINFELIQERNPGANSPDPYELGVVTAYCKDSDQAAPRQCPQWVNDSL